MLLDVNHLVQHNIAVLHYFCSFFLVKIFGFKNLMFLVWFVKEILKKHGQIILICQIFIYF